MIFIDDKLISDEIVDAHFVCDLSRCKGGCCEDGDAGAPLEKEELKQLDTYYERLEPYLSDRGKQEIKKQGKYIYDREFGWVTPTINGGLCCYAIKDKNGMISCGIERAFKDGVLSWKKPISCHLFPIRVQKPQDNRMEMEILNYEPREEEPLCAPACRLGDKLKMPVYRFLKEPLIRKYGEAFYEALEATARHLKEKE